MTGIAWIQYSDTGKTPLLVFIILLPPWDEEIGSCEKDLSAIVVCSRSFSSKESSALFSGNRGTRKQRERDLWSLFADKVRYTTVSSLTALHHVMMPSKLHHHQSRLMVYSRGPFIIKKKHIFFAYFFFKKSLLYRMLLNLDMKTCKIKIYLEYMYIYFWSLKMLTFSSKNILKNFGPSKLSRHWSSSTPSSWFNQNIGCIFIYTKMSVFLICLQTKWLLLFYIHKMVCCCSTSTHFLGEAKKKK